MKAIGLILLGVMSISVSYGKNCDRKVNNFAESKLFGALNSPRFNVNLNTRGHKNVELTKRNKGKDGTNTEVMKITRETESTLIIYANKNTKNDYSSLQNSDYRMTIELDNKCRVSSSKISFIGSDKVEVFGTTVNKEYCEELDDLFKESRDLASLSKEKKVLKLAALDICKQFKFSKETNKTKEVTDETKESSVISE